MKNPDQHVEVQEDGPTFTGPILPADQMTFMIKNGTVHFVLLVPMKELMKQTSLWKIAPDAIKERAVERIGVIFPLPVMMEGLSSLDERGLLEEMYADAEKQREADDDGGR